MLQIPSFVREIRNTHGCETLELVSCQDRLPVFAAAFGGIANGYACSNIEAQNTVEECPKKGAAGRKYGAVQNERRCGVRTCFGEV
jgi:hypothetical protein